GVNKAANNWTFNTTEFDNILQKLKVQVAGTVEKEDGKKPKAKSIAMNEGDTPVIKDSPTTGK
ncbi:hypothetical protein KI387_006692, partial [Taxus chinensis]